MFLVLRLREIILRDNGKMDLLSVVPDILQTVSAETHSLKNNVHLPGFYATVLTVLFVELVSVSFAHVSSNFPSCRLKSEAIEELALDVVEDVSVLSDKPADMMSWSNCENELFALLRSSDRRASLSEFSVSDRVFVPVIPDTDAVAEFVPPVFASGGGGGGPCKCCIMPARILCALVVSPEESADSREFKSVSSGLAPDAEELPEDDSRLDRISDKILEALVVSPDERADCRSFNSLTSELLPEVLASGGGGGGGPCRCCMIPERMLCALVVSPDERADCSEFKSVSSGLVPDAEELPEDDSRLDRISDKMLDALVVSPEERAVCSSFNSLTSELLPVLPVALTESFASGGGGGGGPCRCCMIPARMLCALVVSPDEMAFPSAVRSLARGLESLLVLSDELVDCTSWSNCEKELLELERFPDSSACKSVLRSVEIVQKSPLDSVVDDPPNKLLVWLPDDEFMSIL